MTDLDDTIFAVATGRGGSIAIMRVSGSETGRILDELCGGVPAPRRAALRTISDGRGVRLDRGLVLWFPGPRSYTGRTRPSFTSMPVPPSWTRWRTRCSGQAHDPPNAANSLGERS